MGLVCCIAVYLQVNSQAAYISKGTYSDIKTSSQVKKTYIQYILLTYDGLTTGKKWTITKSRTPGSLLIVHKVNVTTNKFNQ
jgi:hypothetical protein